MKTMSRNVRQLLVFVGTLVLCVVVVTGVSTLKPEEQAEEKNIAEGEGMPVSVVEVQPQAYTAIVTALGEVVPMWESSIRAQVAGRVEFISEHLAEGFRVQKGDVLLRLERSAYELEVANANHQLASSETEWMVEKRRGYEAEQNWKRSDFGGEPDSPLTLRMPQLKVTQRAVEASRALLSHAERQLAWTEIRAPFDGVVMARRVDPGETVFTGDEVAVLYSLEAMEVGIALDATQWSLLPQDPAVMSAKLVDPQQGAEWSATITRDSRRFSRASRLRTLFLQVARPLDQNPPLFPGSFMRAELKGREIPNLLRVPESALTKAGKVWVVDADNRLRSHRVEPVFRGEGVVFIHALRKGVQWVAISPNQGFFSGMRVQPVGEGE